MFSKTCEYGIRAILFILTKSSSQERVRLKDIAREIKAPEAFTAKILQILVRHGIVQSITGPKGGFYIDIDDAENIKLIKIVEAIDGDRLVKQCGLGLDKCDAAHPCPVHDRFMIIRADLVNMLSTMNVLDMADKVKNGQAFLRY